MLDFDDRPWGRWEEYKTMLIEMSSKTADRRNSNSIFNLTSVDEDGTKFEYTKSVLDFSKFQKAEPEPELQPKPEEPQTPEFCRISDIFDLRDLPKTGFSGLHPQNLSARPLSVQYSPTRLTLRLPTLGLMTCEDESPDGGYLNRRVVLAGQLH